MSKHITWAIIRSKNAKVITAILSTITYSSESQSNKHVASQEYQNNSSENARLLACYADEEMSSMEETLITGMCFGLLTNVFMQLAKCSRM